MKRGWRKAQRFSTACTNTSKGGSMPRLNKAGVPVLMVAAAVAGAEKAPIKTWNFDADAPGKAPVGLTFGRTGGGAEGSWVVRAEGDAPSAPNVRPQLLERLAAPHSS